MVNHDGLKTTAEAEPESALLEGEDGADPKRSMFAQPVVAVVLFLAALAAGAAMVSSLEKVPVPPEVEEVEDDEPTETERAQETLQQLATLGLADRVVYRSVRGIGVVDLLTGDVDEVTDFAVPSAERLTVLRAADGNYVIDRDDPTIIGLSEISGEIESTELPNRFAAVLFGGVTGGDPDVDVRYAYALEGPYGVDATDLQLISAAEIERDAAHFLVPGLGAVIEGPEGETFVFGANGYRLLSEHRVLAASPAARIEERCEPGCVSYLVRGRTGDGGERELPVQFAPPFDASISPDGEWILLYNSRELVGPTVVQEGVGAQLFETATGRLLPVAAGQPGVPVWSADSSYVGWLDPDGNAAQLVLLFPADRSTVTLDLESIGAPDRDDVTLTFLGAPTPEQG